MSVRRPPARLSVEAGRFARASGSTGHQDLGERSFAEAGLEAGRAGRPARLPGARGDLDLRESRRRRRPTRKVGRPARSRARSRTSPATEAAPGSRPADGARTRSDSPTARRRSPSASRVRSRARVRRTSPATGRRFPSPDAEMRPPRRSSTPRRVQIEGLAAVRPSPQADPARKDDRPFLRPDRPRVGVDDEPAPLRRDGSFRDQLAPHRLVVERLAPEARLLAGDLHAVEDAERLATPPRTRRAGRRGGRPGDAPAAPDSNVTSFSRNLCSQSFSNRSASAATRRYRPSAPRVSTYSKSRKRIRSLHRTGLRREGPGDLVVRFRRARPGLPVENDEEDRPRPTRGRREVSGGAAATASWRRRTELDDLERRAVPCKRRE